MQIKATTAVLALALGGVAAQTDECPLTRAGLDSLNCECPDGYTERSPCRRLDAPGVMKCPCPPVVPAYVVLTESTCTEEGFEDIFDDETCRLVMNAGYYNTRDQNMNGVIDATEDYNNVFVENLSDPPGCWPVDPVITVERPDFVVPPFGFPFACVNTVTKAEGNDAVCSPGFPCFCKVPAYVKVTSGTCTSNGYTDILTDQLCRAVMNEGYYNTRDQNQNGILDADEIYPNPFFNDANTPPGCWPVDPSVQVSNPEFEIPPFGFPFGCVNTLVEGNPMECSDAFPCFCLTGM